MRSGFTLIELAIVLVILGLLAGGVMEGQTLIRQAELRSVIADFKKYQAATHTFRDKYFALPGDMTNATDFWGSVGGASHTNDSTCSGTASTDAKTCNGDGNGEVEYSNSNSVEEDTRLWQQLANAGLIEGQYCGTSASLCGSSGAYVGGINVPAPKISGGFYRVAYAGYTAGSTMAFAGDYGNFLTLGVIGNSQAKPNSLPFTPAEAWNIDKKLDDGLPGSGGTQGSKGKGGTGTLCTSAAGIAPPGDAGATYNLSNTNKDCFVYFLRAF